MDKKTKASTLLTTYSKNEEDMSSIFVRKNFTLLQMVLSCIIHIRE